MCLLDKKEHCGGRSQHLGPELEDTDVFHIDAHLSLPLLLLVLLTTDQALRARETGVLVSAVRTCAFLLIKTDGQLKDLLGLCLLWILCLVMYSFVMYTFTRGNRVNSETGCLRGSIGGFGHFAQKCVMLGCRYRGS